jgi:RNA polymerase sigma factor (TIGR02999 family)
MRRQAGAVTLLLRQIRSIDSSSLERLVELIYPELRRLARGQLRRERPGHVLQPTALVNEAYLRLVAHDEQNWENRAHFFGAAAQAMRRILVDYARGQNARKRDAAWLPPAEAVAAHLGDVAAVDLLALDQALTELEKRSTRQARVVQLRYFGGLSVPETAEALGVTQRTVDRDWATARAWLRLRLTP